MLPISAAMGVSVTSTATLALQALLPSNTCRFGCSCDLTYELSEGVILLQDEVFSDLHLLHRYRIIRGMRLLS